MTTQREPSPRVRPRKPVTKPAEPEPAGSGSLADQVRTSAARATWLGPTDAAAVELAVRLAGIIEAVEPTVENVRQMAPAASILQRLLTDLGLTSKGRPADTTEETGVTWLDDLRNKAAANRGRAHAADRNA